MRTKVKLLSLILLIALLCAFKPGIIGDMGVAGFKALNWTRSPAGVWSPNPGLGSELVVNGGFDSDVNGWTPLQLNGDTPPTLTSEVGGQSGNYLKITNGGTTTRGSAYQQITVVHYTWYRLTGYGKEIGAYANIGLGTSAGNSAAYLGSGNIAGSWVSQFKGIIVTPNITTFYLNLFDSSGTNSGYDSLSLKPLTMAHLFAVRNYGHQVGFQANLTTSSHIPGGVVVRYSDSNNYVLCWHDGTNLHLDKVVAGVPTSLINAVTAYVAGAQIAIKWNGADTAQAWYAGAQVGADQDVSAVPAGNWAGLFGTDSTVQLTNPAIN